jgi:chromate transporter
MQDNLLLRLIIVLAPLSFVTIGGGQTILTELHRQVVDVHHWVTDNEFLELYSLSRMAPGPTPTIITMIGWKAGGIPAALVGTAAIYLPAILAMFALAGVWQRYRGALWQQAVEEGLAPVGVGMFLATVVTLLLAPNLGWLGWAVVAGTAGVLLYSRINPLWLIGAGSAAFLAQSFFR